MYFRAASVFRTNRWLTAARKCAGQTGRKWLKGSNVSHSLLPPFLILFISSRRLSLARPAMRLSGRRKRFSKSPRPLSFSLSSFGKDEASRSFSFCFLLKNFQNARPFLRAVHLPTDDRCYSISRTVSDNLRPRPSRAYTIRGLVSEATVLAFTIIHNTPYSLSARTLFLARKNFHHGLPCHGRTNLFAIYSFFLLFILYLSFPAF